MPTHLHIGDFGKDLDDEVAALVTAGLVRSGSVRLAGTIANLHPANERARLAKGTYNALGLDVPVAAGSPCDWDRPADAYEFDVPHLAPVDSLEPSNHELFRQIATNVPDQSLDLVLMSGLTDAYLLMGVNRGLFQTKVRSITLMSGVLTDKAGRLDLDHNGFLRPDQSANNTFDFASAERCYHYAQALEVPLTVVTRNAAYAAKVPRAFYDDLAATGHPVGLRLQAAQRRSIQQLWEQANLPFDHPDRTLPAGPPDSPRTADWFRGAFCDGAGEGLAGGDDIWPHIAGFAQYDALAVLAAIPHVRDELFAPMEHKTPHGVTNRVIGVSPAENGVRDADLLRQTLTGLAVSAVETTKEYA